MPARRTGGLIRVGVIGKRGHAGRLIRILSDRPDVELAVVYTPHPPSPQEVGLPFSQRFDDLLVCNAIVIASPTPTHAGYLKKLNRYPGYVFLEKPAVSTIAQNRILRRWSNARKKRVHIDFNMRSGAWAQLIKKMIKDRRIGRVLAWDVHTSHGLAFAKRYQNSWRSRAGASSGVMETVGIHYINLALDLFGPIQKSDMIIRRIVHPRGPADFGVLRLQHKSGALTTLRHSYASPLINRFMIIGTNGYWEYDGQEAKLFSPRNTFDQRGFFAKPPLCKVWEINIEKSDQNSWASAMEDFLSHVKRKKGFSTKDFHLALDSMEVIFDTPIFSAQ